MGTLERIWKKTAKVGSATGMIKPGEALTAVSTGRLQRFYGEDGRHQRFDRGPKVWMGLVSGRFFVTDGRRVATAAMINLITNGELSWDNLSLQFMTPRNTGVYLSIGNVEYADQFFSCLKAEHDSAWMQTPRKLQSDLILHCGSLGLNWNNNTDPVQVAASEEQIRRWAAGEITSGEPVRNVLGLMNSPLDLNLYLDEFPA
jgi:hypothetical protein